MFHLNYLGSKRERMGQACARGNSKVEGKDVHGSEDEVDGGNMGKRQRADRDRFGV